MPCNLSAPSFPSPPCSPYPTSRELLPGHDRLALALALTVRLAYLLSLLAAFPLQVNGIALVCCCCVQHSCRWSLPLVFPICETDTAAHAGLCLLVPPEQCQLDRAQHGCRPRSVQMQPFRDSIAWLRHPRTSQVRSISAAACMPASQPVGLE